MSNKKDGLRQQVIAIRASIADAERAFGQASVANYDPSSWAHIYNAATAMVKAKRQLERLVYTHNLQAKRG